MKPVDRPSPNHGPRKGTAGIDMMLLHYTGMKTGEEALARLCDPAAEVSAHYFVEEDGRVFRLVPEDRRAWHAGASRWAGVTDINSRSIGIEIVNPGHEWGYRAFPEAQIAALETLLADIAARHAIPAARYLAHSDVAPERKTDPGELFPWERLAAKGFGIWPHAGDARKAPLQTHDAMAEYQMALARFGYDMTSTGELDDRTRLVTVAFQRHFEPEAVGSEGEGHPSTASLAKARVLAAYCP